MKNRLLFLSTLIAVLLLSACSTPKYYFCQLYQTKPAENIDQFSEKDGYLIYENNQCIIYYYFWAEGGNTSFKIYNKTDDILTIDLGQSFFTLNGMAYDLFQNSSYSQGYVVGSGSSSSSSSSFSYFDSQSQAGATGARVSAGSAIFTNNSLVAAGGSVGAAKSYRNTEANLYTWGFSAANSTFQSKSAERTVSEKQLISIPPHYAKVINSYSIVNAPLLNCELERYPSTQSKPLLFNSSNTPITFSIYLTYRSGQNSDWQNLRNAFYVTQIANYAEPSVTKYVERSEPCDNLKNINQRSPYVKLYDPYLKNNICIPSSTFYLWYDVNSYTKLYDLSPYRYSESYKAYMLVGNSNTVRSANDNMIAPELELPNPYGNLVKLSDFRGKVVLIDFWASWNNASRQNKSDLRRLYNLYHDKGFEIFSVSLDTDAQAWKDAIREDQLVWSNHVCDFKKWKSEAVYAYGAYSLPCLILIDKDGYIVTKNYRVEVIENVLKQMLD